MAFQSMDDLCDYLQSEIDSALIDNVAESVRSQMLEHIQTDVYSVYEPEIYLRRYENGGLSDSRNITPSLVSKGVLEVENKTPFNTDPECSIDPSYHTDNYGYGLAGLIEYGYGWSEAHYDYPRKGRSYLKKRPFIANTRADLKTNKQHIQALKDGLKTRGIRFK